MMLYLSDKAEDSVDEAQLPGAGLASLRERVQPVRGEDHP